MGTVYKQLSITERRRIERWRHAKVPVDEMARVLRRCRSTMSRELKRNYFSDESMPKCDGYYGAATHLMQANLHFHSLDKCSFGWKDSSSHYFTNSPTSVQNRHQVSH